MLDVSSLQVQTVDIDTLRPHPRNPRIHPDSAIEKLMHSMEKFGWTNPVLVDAEMTILAGHARCVAARKMGQTEIPVIVLPLTGADADAYLITDNRVQDETQWDTRTLAPLLRDLQGQGITVADLALDQREARDLLRGLQIDESTHALDRLLEQAGDGDDDELRDHGDGSIEEDLRDGNDDPHARRPVPDAAETSGVHAIPADPPPQYFQISYSITAEEREIVMQALKRARERDNLDTSNDALVAICRGYLAQA